MDAIVIEQLTKRYGARRGIDDVSLRVPAGNLFGFIGPNGAGKTTTIRDPPRPARADRGPGAQLLGRDAAGRRPGGAGPESATSPARPTSTPTCGSTTCSPTSAASTPATTRPTARADRRLRRLDHGARAADLSLGNRKKVALAAALQHRPRLVVLDEPTGGLDPVMRARLFEVLEGEVAGGATVFFSSHDLAEVQAVCRRVAVLSEGKLVAVDEVARLRGREVRRGPRDVSPTGARRPASRPWPRWPGSTA